MQTGNLESFYRNDKLCGKRHHFDRIWPNEIRKVYIRARFTVYIWRLKIDTASFLSHKISFVHAPLLASMMFTILLLFRF